MSETNKPLKRKNHEEIKMDVLEKIKKFSNIHFDENDGFVGICPICNKEFYNSVSEMNSRLKKKLWNRTDIKEITCDSKNCSAKVIANDEAIKKIKEKNTIEKYGSLQNFYDYTKEKQKKGLEKKYDTPEKWKEHCKVAAEKAKETYFRKTGFTHNMRNPECVKLNQKHRAKTIKNMSEEKKEQWYKKRVETHKKNKTLMFGGVSPLSKKFRSKEADGFFEELSKKDFFKGKELFFSESEKKVTRSFPGYGIQYSLDFYSPDDSIFVEFNGDFWHANPELYSKDDLLNIPRDGKIVTFAAHEIWEKDQSRNKYLEEELGAKCFVVWEKDWKENRELTIEKLLKEINGEKNE